MKRRGLFRTILLLGWLLAQTLWATDPPSTEKVFTLSGTVSIQDGNGKSLNDYSDVVLYIPVVNSNRGFRPRTENPVIVNRRMAFVPPVLPVLKRTKVLFKNEDENVHNVYSLSTAKPFDLGITQKGEVRSVTFDQTGICRLYCNIHNMMIGYVLILGNPYFTQARADGSFLIPDLPRGDYEIVCWYRYGDQVRKRISVTNGSQLNFELIKTHGDPLHNNKWGKPYRPAY